MQKLLDCFYEIAKASHFRVLRQRFWAIPAGIGSLTGRDYRRVSLISKARWWSSLDRWSARLDRRITLDRNFGLRSLVVSKCRNANDNSLFFFYLLWASRMMIDWYDRWRFWQFEPPLRYGSPVRGYLAPVALDLVSGERATTLIDVFPLGVCVLNELLRTNDRSLWAGLSFRFPPNPCEKSANPIIPLLLPNKRVWIRFL